MKKIKPSKRANSPLLDRIKAEIDRTVMLKSSRDELARSKNNPLPHILGTEINPVEQVRVENSYKPKHTPKQKRREDVNQSAFRIVQTLTKVK
jgi:hypothetical protein